MLLHLAGSVPFVGSKLPLESVQVFVLTAGKHAFPRMFPKVCCTGAGVTKGVALPLASIQAAGSGARAGNRISFGWKKRSCLGCGIPLISLDQTTSGQIPLN